MSGWIVYSKDGSLERCKLRSLEYGGTAMGERAVTATFDYHSEVAFEVFDYIEYRGERFELEAVPTVKKLSSFEYQYELRFVSLKYELERCEMRDLVPSDNGVVYPTPLTFSFTGDVRYLTDRIQACLDAMYGAGVWKITIAEGTSSEEKNITIAQQNCWNALALVNSTYGLNFYIKGRTITIGGEQPLVSHTFEYGKGNGLYEIGRASDTETGIVTKLRAYGSTRNLDYSYPKKPEWSDSVLPVSFALSPLRLMLPSFKTDGKTDYVLADDAAISKYGIREASMVYDDIYPSIAGATYNGQAIDEIKAVDAVDESKKTFVVYLHELGFDLEEHLTTSDAQISMKSGALQGYTFTISSIEKQTGGYKITLGKNSLENSEESGAYVPGVNWNMKAGDKFVLINILMPQKYIRDAENRLLARANEYLAQYSKTNFSYNIGLHDKFLIQNPSVYDSLIEGSKLKVYDKKIGIDEEVTIQSITITENLEDNILPQVKVTLNNEPSASTLDRIQGKLNEVAAETAANGFTTQSEIMAQYRRKLDKPFFDKLFVAIDENGNEIPSTDVITPIAYIKAKYHVASVGGFTMYAMDKDVDIPSLASGLPFDGRTIWYNPDTQQIEVIGGTGGGSGEGVSNFWDLSGIPSWITISKPKYTYTEIEGTPDLSVYALKTQIPSLSGYATESWVTKQNYATKATTLSGYGITDAYTKTNVDDLLKSYVTLGGTPQTITGEKNFVGGLKVNGSPIYYDTEKKYWKLEGDLLVTGGVTMYGNEGTYTPSTIMDAIAVDGTTISKDGGVLKVIGGTGGGVADSVAWANITGKPTWIGSSKPTYSYSEITGAISTTELQNYLTSNSYLNVTSGDNRYLQLSGGTISGISGNYTPLIVETKSLPEVWLQFKDTVGNTYIGSDKGQPAVYIEGDRNHLLLHSGNYSQYALPLSGGTINGNIQLGDDSNTSYYALLAKQNGNVISLGLDYGYGTLGYRQSGTTNWNLLSVANKNVLCSFDGGNNWNTIWHSGNDGTGSGLDADLLDGLHLFSPGRGTGGVANIGGDGVMEISSIIDFHSNNSDGNDFNTRLYSIGIYKNQVQLPTSSGTLALTTDNVASANILATSYSENINYGTYHSALKLIYNTNYNDYGFPSLYVSGLSVMAGYTGWQLMSPGGAAENPYFRSLQDTGAWKPWRQIAFLTDNVASATKLQTARTIWGQSFDGTGNVSGDISNLSTIVFDTSLGAPNIGYLWTNTRGMHMDMSGLGTEQQGTNLTLTPSGNVGIGTASPSQKLHVNGHIWSDGDIGAQSKIIAYGNVIANGNIGVGTENPSAKVHIVNNTNTSTGLLLDGGWSGYGFLYNGISILLNGEYYGGIGVNTVSSAYGSTAAAGTYITNAKSGEYMNFYNEGGTFLKSSLLVNGGITMYSDQRKKTILNHVELSLKQIANAPLIEHYYNSDEKKTTHVGSIAQYWASMNDWFCKLDSEGFYTMEIQNAALASAISIARELDRYETKTDKAIKKLKKRICELEEEIERLKSA